MRLFLDRNGKKLWQGHVLEVLRSLPAESVNCVVTSPPYYGLRAYGTEPQVWGGDPACGHDDTIPASAPQQTGGTGAASAKQLTNQGSQFGNHAWGDVARAPGWQSKNGQGATRLNGGKPGLDAVHKATGEKSGGSYCQHCGAWRGELGSEPTPALFIAHLVEIFREVRRVLKKNGTLWCNLGDSYAGSGKGPSASLNKSNHHSQGINSGATPEGFKAKDLMMLPSRLAIALCDDGWYVRSHIVWAKKSCMPESVKDRPTNAWESIFLLSKSSRYYYNAEAVAEPMTGEAHAPGNIKLDASRNDRDSMDKTWGSNGFRNMRNVWLLGPEPYPDAHFATFPTEIPKRAILAGCPEGGVVLDPFAGSGTSLQVAHQLGRVAWGIELNEGYCALAAHRLRQDVLPLEFVS